MNAKKMISAALSCMLLLGLVACGKTEDNWTRPASSATSSEESKTNILDTTNVLTGEKLEDGTARNNRFTAIMVNNIDKSRPTSGLSDASVLFEIVTEGGITRFMALYDDYKTIPKVGSVRSARDQFLQIIIPWQAYYVHIGQSTVAKEYLKNYQYQDYNLDGDTYGGEKSSQDAAVKAGNIYWRDSARLNKGFASEYTAYTSGETIESVIKDNDLNDTKDYTTNFLNFVPYNEKARTIESEDKTDIKIIHSANQYETDFKYDTADKQYKMSQYNAHLAKTQETIDEDNDEQVAFENVIALYANMSVYPATDGLMKVDYAAGGTGYYFNGGKYEEVKWEKSSVEAPLTLKSVATGEELEINTGKTYIAVVNSELENDFTQSLEKTESAK